MIELSNQKFVYTTYIRTNPDRLWQALTTSEDTELYFFNSKVQSTWQVGENITFFRDSKLDVTGDLLELEQCKKLSYTWTSPEDPTLRNEPTVVTFLIKELEETVKLTLIHSNLVESDIVDDSDTFWGLNNGWPAILSNLKSYLESGNTLKAIHA